MISSEIKYAFNQIETSLIAFVSNIQLKLQHIVPNLPVYFSNTGDFSYYVDKKFIETKNEELYQKTPRVTIKLDDIQQNIQEDSNQYNKINYLFDNNDGEGPLAYQCVARRKAYNIQLTCNFVSPNLISALNYFEVMSTLCTRDNVFTYEFLGNTIQSAYNITQSGNEIPTIDMGQGGTRNVNIINMIELQLHLIVPRVESIIRVDDTGFDAIGIHLNSENYEEKIIHKYEDLRNEQ